MQPLVNLILVNGRDTLSQLGSEASLWFVPDGRTVFVYVPPWPAGTLQPSSDDRSSRSRFRGEMTLSPRLSSRHVDPAPPEGADRRSEPPTSIVRITGPLGDVMEGGQAQFAVNRSNNVVGDVPWHWTATSPAVIPPPPP